MKKTNEIKNILMAIAALACVLAQGACQNSLLERAKTTQAIATSSKLVLGPASGGATVVKGGTVDLGSGALGLPVTLNLSIKNEGSAALAIDADNIAIVQQNLAQGAQVEFSLSKKPDASVAVGGSTTLTISCTPLSAGKKQATITIGTNDVSATRFAFTVTATGNATAVATPSFAPFGGTFSLDKGVTISCATDGAAIYYTFAVGLPSDPTAQSTLYLGASIPVKGNKTTLTLKAVAMKPGWENSVIASGTYTINYDKVSTPQFIVGETPTMGGGYATDQAVTLGCATDGVSLYYTSSASGQPADPTTASNLYSGTAIQAQGNGTTLAIKVLAVKAGMEDSSITGATFAINYSQVTKPQFSIDGAPADAGTYDVEKNIVISSSTPDALISYTTDGTGWSTAAAGPVVVPMTASTSIQAIARKTQMIDSTTASASYSLKVKTPSIGLAAGTYSGAKSAAINEATSGAEIRYTTNGGDPRTAGAIYGSAVSIAASGQLRAIGRKSGWLDSDEANANYVIQYNLTAQGDASGYASGSGWKDSGSSASISATPSSGYFFRNWTIMAGGSTGAVIADPTSMSTTVSIGSGDVTVQANFMYAQLYVVPNDQAASVSVFKIDSVSGALSQVPGSPYSTGTTPRKILADSIGQHVFVLCSGSNCVYSFSVDASTGALSSVTGSPFATGSGPMDMTLSKDGSYLYVCNSTAKTVSAFSVSSGALSPIGTATALASATSPSATLVSPNGKFLYITDTTKIYALAISSSDGSLGVVSGSPFASGGTNCSGLTFDNTGAYLFGGHANTPGLFVYTANATTGALAALSGSPFASTKYFNKLYFDPSYRFLYAFSNSGLVVSAFTMSSGTLTAVSGSPYTTSSAPSSVAMDPAGAFLFLGCGANSAGVYGYSINGTSGALTAYSASPYLGSSYDWNILMDKSSRFLYSLDGYGSKIWGWSITGSAGALTPLSGSQPSVPGTFHYYSPIIVHPN